MPFTKRSYTRRPYRRRPAYRKRVTGLATRPRMMGRSRFLRRWNQVDSRVFWFKTNAVIELNNNNHQYYEFRTSALDVLNPQGWTQLKSMYDQYKILGYKYRLFPSNVGTESTANAGAGALALDRGNHAVWIDQRFDPNVQQPTQISQVINSASCRLINPRRPYVVSIWRPRGKPNWGSTRDIATAPDPWRAAINHLIEGGSVQPPATTKVIYYYTIQWKVVFRGRQDD